MYLSAVFRLPLASWHSFGVVLDLVGVLLSLPFELPIFAILLILLGVIVLWPELMGTKNIINSPQEIVKLPTLNSKATAQVQAHKVG